MTRRRGRDGGQATVELVLVLPVVILALLLVIQVGLIARAQVLVVNAAREGARAAAVDGPSAAHDAAAASPGLRDTRVTVRASTGPGQTGDLVRVQVRYRVPTDVPLVGPLVGEPSLTAEVVMRAEGPGG
ncbi:TadE/TadG family type IV pilus assembly protein [Aquihabitans daechungensis]|uniref:TadE/TadG family type IV pilus assembly protein n=1 Tax=Aquihabitans daechungensis TaxID=1052257 RepID=UPI003BA0F607